MEHLVIPGTGGMAGTPRKTFTLGECLAWTGTFLALLILGAHFFRAGNHALTLCLMGVVLLHAGSAAWKTYAVPFHICIIVKFLNKTIF